MDDPVDSGAGWFQVPLNHAIIARNHAFLT